MIEQLTQYPIIPYTVGISTGLFLALVLIQIEQLLRRTSIRRRQSKLEQRAFRQAALRARAREEATEIDDERMMCSACWEQRHPGETWFLHKRTLCIDHLMMERGSSQTANHQEYALHH